MRASECAEEYERCEICEQRRRMRRALSRQAAAKRRVGHTLCFDTPPTRGAARCHDDVDAILRHAIKMSLLIRLMLRRQFTRVRWRYDIRCCYCARRVVMLLLLLRHADASWSDYAPDAPRAPEI